MRADASRKRAILVRFKPVLLYRDRDGGQRLNRINATRAYQNETRSMSFCEFEQVNGPIKIMLDDLPTTCCPIESGKDAWIRSGIDNPIDFANRLEITRRSEIAVNKLHPVLAERPNIQVTSGTTEIIQADNLESRIMIEQAVGDTASGETANSGE